MPPKNIRSLTLRIPEPIHHKLKVIAALQNTTLTGAICYLVDKERIRDMEQTPVIKSVLHGTVSGPDDQADQEEAKGPSSKTKAILQKRKDDAPVNMD